MTNNTMMLSIICLEIHTRTHVKELVDNIYHLFEKQVQ